MSVFMVSNDTLDLLASMTSYTHMGIRMPMWKVNTAPHLTKGIEYWKASGTNGLLPFDAGMVKYELFEANLHALKERYSDSVEEYTCEPFRPVDVHSIPVSKLLGAIQCYSYQINANNEDNFASIYTVICRAEVIGKIMGDEWEYTRSEVELKWSESALTLSDPII